MDAARAARFKEKIRDLMGEKDAHEPSYWSLERLARLHGGPTMTSDDMCDLVRFLVDDDVWNFLPAIAGLLSAVARDSDGFARVMIALERKTANDLAAGSIVDAVWSVGASEPETALRLARRLLTRGGLGYPHLLIGGATAKLPDECDALTQELFGSDDAKFRTIAIKSWICAGSRVGGAVLENLERASESGDANVRAAAVSAFIVFYDNDRRRCMEAIERMTAYPECAWHLAGRIWTSSPFDDETSLRLLDACSELTDVNVRQEVHRALRKLAERNLAKVLNIVLKYAARDGYVGGTGEDVLEKLGKAHGAKAVTAMLGAPMNHVGVVVYAPSMIKRMIDGAGEDGLEPVFKAIHSGTNLRAIGIDALHGVISDPRAKDESRAPVLQAIEEFLERLAESKGVHCSANGDRATRCAQLLLAIRHHRVLDYDLALKNVGGFPALLSLFGERWVLEKKQSNQTHPLLYFLAQELPTKEERKTLLERLHSAETHKDRFNSVCKLRRVSGAWRFLYDLDRNLSLLKRTEYGAMYAKRLKNGGEFFDTISEIDFVMQFWNKCHIKIEPHIEEQRNLAADVESSRKKPKKLDVRLEVGGRQVYVEILNPEMFSELRLFSGARGIRNRIKGKIYDKVKDQLSKLDGRGYPVILAIDIGRSEVNYEFVEDYLWGPMIGRFYINQEGDIDDWQSGRDETKSMHELDRATDVISAVVCYKMQLRDDLKPWMEYRIISNPHARVKLDDSETEFLKKCLGNTASSRPTSPAKNITAPSSMRPLIPDDKFMMFEDYLQRPDPQGWVTVMSTTDWSAKDCRFVFSALASTDSVTDLLSTSDHEVRTQFGTPTLANCDGGAPFDLNDRYSDGNIRMEPFVLRRNFHGARPDTYEIVQNFALYHDLFFDHERAAYVDLDGEEIVRVSPSSMQVREDALRDYLAARKMVLVLYHHHRRQRDMQVADVFGTERVDKDLDGDDSIYQIVIGHFLENGGALSMITGKKIVRPYDEPLHRDYVSALDRAQDYATYDCQVNNKRVEKSCDIESRRQPGPYLTPVFFKKDVMSKYHDSSRYDVKDGTIWHRDFWYLEFGENDDLIHVWLGDLGRIPHSEQLYWKHYNVMPRGGLEGSFVRRELLGDFKPSNSKCEVLLALKSRINSNFQRRFGFELFLDVSSRGTAEPHDLAHDEETEFNEQMLNLAKSFVDTINKENLRAGPQDKQTPIRLLSMFLLKHGLAHDKANKLESAFRIIQQLRSKGAAHPTGPEYEQLLERLGLKHVPPRDRFGRIVASFYALLSKFNSWLESVPSQRRPNQNTGTSDD